ncbi:MAG: cation transporter [Acidimicrobiia bacterium]|nr:cation transporter [Acidimicrobiia bacterium]
MSASTVHSHPQGGPAPGHRGHGHGPGGRLSSPTSVISMALVANTILAIGQVVAGIVWGSIALVADSTHQVVDVVGLAIALLAVRIAARGVTARNTFGWGRADVLGAMASSTLLLVSSVWIVFEAVRRLSDPHGIEGVPVLVVAVIGFVVNAASAAALARGEGSMATRAAVVHLIGDAAGSLGVLVSAVAVLAADATWIDPLVAIGIALWVGWTGWSLLRSSGRVLLDVVPAGLSTTEVAATIGTVEGVADVHHIHLWEPASGDPSVSAHITVDGDMAVHESQALLDRVRLALVEVHGVRHATFEVECHPCDDGEHGAGRVAHVEGE